MTSRPDERAPLRELAMRARELAIAVLDAVRDGLDPSLSMPGPARSDVFIDLRRDVALCSIRISPAADMRVGVAVWPEKGDPVTVGTVGVGECPERVVSQTLRVVHGLAFAALFYQERVADQRVGVRW